MSVQNIKIGPSSLGPIKDSIKNLERYHELGFRACEIAFTYGTYIKNEEDARKIGEAAKKLGIDLSIHAQYWINLNSAEVEKVEKSKERILECLKVGTWLGVKRVIFHPGYYSKKGKEPKKETYEKIKKEIMNLQELRKKNKYTPELAPEVMGRVNVFGSYEEISQLVSDTQCSFCIDFAHMLAREKGYKFNDIKNKFKYKDWHVHFSGIEYGEKGEKKHIPTKESEFKELLTHLPKDKSIIIISEAPDPVKDSVLGLKILKSLT